MLLPLCYGLLGLVIGSFLNVLILRRSVFSLDGRSACMSCQMQLAWYDMVPVFSWVALRGRCRSCGSTISVQYPLVEASTAALFALVGGTSLALDIPAALLALFIVSILVAICAYDMRHTIIPDPWAYLFAGAALAFTLYRGVPVDSALFSYLVAGPVAALPISTLWFVSGGRWIGLGDAKLSLGLGWLLGPLYGIVAVFFGFVIGAVISVFVLMPLPSLMRIIEQKGIARFRAGGRQLTMKSEVPFGPFLVASCFIIWFALLYRVPLPF